MKIRNDKTNENESKAQKHGHIDHQTKATDVNSTVHPPIIESPHANRFGETGKRSIDELNLKLSFHFNSH